MLGNTVVSANSTTYYVAMAHGAKTDLATKAVLDFVHPHLSRRTIDMYEDNEGAKKGIG